jgi:pimeloyl-ACP methyl ester carboxylesterase
MVADEVADVEAIADELGLERFGVTGGSGGGPHALACAALLPHRVVRPACTVGVAPLGASGLTEEEWLAGMDPENVKEFRWAQAGEDVLMSELEQLQKQLEERVAVDRPRRLRAERVRPCAARPTRSDTDHPGGNRRTGGERGRRLGR